MAGKRPGEDEVLGDFGFGREAQHPVEFPNRSLLMEICIARKYVVAHTFLKRPVNERTAPMDDITPIGFSFLDLVLVPRDWLHSVETIWSDRYAALASHHFLVYTRLTIALKPEQPTVQRKLDWSALRDPHLRNSCASLVETGLPKQQETCQAIAAGRNYEKM